MRSIITRLLLAAIICGSLNTIHAQDNKADWQKGIDWAANDTGAPDCPWLYAPSNIDCLTLGAATANNSGNRACLIDKAIIAARNGYDGAAFGLTLITQCHNQGAAQALLGAGPKAVADYLRTF